MKRKIFVALIALGSAAAPPAAAQEVFAGVYAHAVDTPLTFETEEGGVDFQLGYRFAPVAALAFIGKPSPYLIASLNSAGDTNFAGVGLSWKIGAGPVYLRPGAGVVIHDGPDFRVGANRKRTDLGSRVVFSPEIAVGTQLSDRVAIEASWVHVSHARIFDSGQNPGIDMFGVRLNWKM